MKLFAAAALAGGLLIAGGANAAVLFSEDFSGYNPGLIPHGAQFAVSTTGNTITTDYSYRVPNGQNHGGQPDSMYDEGAWTIGTNPYAVHDLWVNQPSNNEFLMLNGATVNSNPPATAYESGAIAIGPGTYTYSYELLNLCCNANGPAGTPSYLQLWYFSNGSPTPMNINTVVSTTAAANGWQLVSGNFSITQQGGFIRLGLTDTSTVFSGNDFGVDNIRLATAAPEPTSWALMILGFGAAGAMMRRRARVLA